MNVSELEEEILPPCCNLSASPVEAYPTEGVSLVRGFLSGARTVLVIAHRITASLEWAWFPFAAERGGNTCAADLHAKSMIEAVERQLVVSGHECVILPYPDPCGISFKRLAAFTGTGELGESFLFLHREWGPWVHLRVLLTDAVVTPTRTEPKGICTHCRKCLEVCPGKALSPGKHDLQQCAKTQQRLRETLQIQANYRYKCEACARACPVGQAPDEIAIRSKGPAY